MQSELPTALNVFDTDYQLKYCPSRFLYIYSFIFFFVLLCELRGRLVAMWIDRSARCHGPRAHVWDKKQVELKSME